MPGISLVQPIRAHGFPDQVQGPLAWTGIESLRVEDHIIQLSKEDIWEIEEALIAFKETQHPRQDIVAENFPLSELLRQKLRSISNEIHMGRGFTVLRGLDPSKYSEEENVLIYAGVSSHIGDRRTHMTHIYDRSRVGASRIDEQIKTKYPPNELSVKMNFHTDVDAGDILSLYTQNLSISGGEQYLASFWHVYNTLIKDAPEVLKTLSENWRFEMPQMDGTVDIIDRPVMYFHEGKLQVTFAAAFMVGSEYAKRTAAAPDLTSKQKYAMRKLLEVCRESSIKLTPRRGDMLFVNNLCLLHARGAFVDDFNSGNYRHLLSMMLQDSQNEWSKPQGFADTIERSFQLSESLGSIPTLTEREQQAYDYEAYLLAHGLSGKVGSDPSKPKPDGPFPPTPKPPPPPRHD